jgi:hypothetical protein
MNLKFQLLKTLVTLRNAAPFEENPVNKGFKHISVTTPQPAKTPRVQASRRFCYSRYLTAANGVHLDPL